MCEQGTSGLLISDDQISHVVLLKQEQKTPVLLAALPGFINQGAVNLWVADANRGAANTPSFHFDKRKSNCGANVALSVRVSEWPLIFLINHPPLDQRVPGFEFWRAHRAVFLNL